MKISVGIKALNEEAHIGASLDSALAAVAPLGGEVVLADSGSRDRTVEIALQRPVRVFQLADPSERCCGTGAQLAFQHSKGEYFYLLDGDMLLNKEFLRVGLEFLEANPEVAGVGGMVIEQNTANAEFSIRAKEAHRAARGVEFVDRLDCGGLYRSSAIQSAGYFADRNLHAFEEFELGARLLSKGWKLARIDQPAVDHFGHKENSYLLLWRRIKSGYASCLGEVLRSAIGKPQFSIVLSRLSHLRHSAAIYIWWLLLALCVWLSPLVALGLLVVPIIFLSLRRGTIGLGVYSFVSWNVMAAGLLAGLFRRRAEPRSPLNSIQLSLEEQPAAPSGAVS